MEAIKVHGVPSAVQTMGPGTCMSLGSPPLTMSPGPSASCWCPPQDLHLPLAKSQESLEGSHLALCPPCTGKAEPEAQGKASLLTQVWTQALPSLGSPS